MKVYVEMTEEEYDFYKEYKKNKQIIKDNLYKIQARYIKEGLTSREKEIFWLLNKVLLTMFDIKEE